MTGFIGAILILVFLTFAGLMFLERLSALLALPLMAISFILVAVIGDLVQPSAPADPHGGESRWGTWRAYQRTLREGLRERLAAHQEAIDRLRALCPTGSAAGTRNVDPEELRRLTAALRAEEESRREKLRSALQAYPDFFAKPPHRPGVQARIDDEMDRVPIGPLLRELGHLLEHREGSGLDEPCAALLHATERIHSRAARALAQRAEGAQTCLDGLAYIGGYVGLSLRAGSLTLYATIIATLFGGMFAMYVRNLKIAERLVYWTAEFAGDRPMIVALAVFLSTALIFTSVGGLGTVMMLGTIILPVLRSIGLSPIVGAGVFLLAIAAGGTLNPVSRRLYLDFYGLTPTQLDGILWSMVGLYSLTGLGWIVWGARRALLSSFHAVAVVEPKPRQAGVPLRLMAAPIVPVAMVYFADIDEIVAFVLSIAYMFLCVCRQEGATRQLARSLIEGAQAVVPPVLLMLGIGILITALSTPPVQGYLKPLIAAVAPNSRWTYLVTFGVGAPLALYRGPLNVWGMGLAISAILLATTNIPPAAVLGGILAAGMLQSVCDPTNTANVWIAGFQGVGVNEILRHLLLPVWLAAMAAVGLFSILCFQ